jgi:hypothetical protein
MIVLKYYVYISKENVEEMHKAEEQWAQISGIIEPQPLLHPKRAIVWE